MASSPITSPQTEGEKGGSSDRFPLLGLWNHCGWWLQPWNQKTFASWQESYDKPRQSVEKQRHCSADKSPPRPGYGHTGLWELDCTEGRTPKNECFWTVVLEKTPESSLDSKEIKPVNLKGNQPWIFIGRTDAEAEAPILWPPVVKTESLVKMLMLGKVEGRRRRGPQSMRW